MIGDRQLAIRNAAENKDAGVAFSADKYRAMAAHFKSRLRLSVEIH